MKCSYERIFKIRPLNTPLALTMVFDEDGRIYSRQSNRKHKKHSDKSAHEETAAIPPHQQSGQRRKSQDVAKIQYDSSVCSADIF